MNNIERVNKYYLKETHQIEMNVLFIKIGRN